MSGGCIGASEHHPVPGEKRASDQSQVNNTSDGRPRASLGRVSRAIALRIQHASHSPRQTQCRRCHRESQPHGQLQCEHVGEVLQRVLVAALDAVEHVGLLAVALRVHGGVGDAVLTPSIGDLHRKPLRHEGSGSDRPKDVPVHAGERERRPNLTCNNDRFLAVAGWIRSECHHMSGVEQERLGTFRANSAS